MDLQLIKTFLTVLETGNYSNAAIELDYAQSTITNQIQTLENHFGGTKLLTRKGNLMVPTASGEIFKEYANQLMEIYLKSKDEIITSKQSIIRVGTIASLSETYMPIVIQTIKSIYSDMKIQLFNSNPKTLYSMLHSNNLDMIFVIDNKHRHTGFSTKQINEEQLVFVISANHRLAKKVSVGFDDIQKEKFILTENGCNFRKLLIAEFAKNNSFPQIAMELGSIDAIKKAILDNWGMGFLPSFLIKESDSLVSIAYKNVNTNLYSQVI